MNKKIKKAVLLFPIVLLGLASCVSLPNPINNNEEIPSEKKDNVVKDYVTKYTIKDVSPKSELGIGHELIITGGKGQMFFNGKVVDNFLGIYADEQSLNVDFRKNTEPVIFSYQFKGINARLITTFISWADEDVKVTIEKEVIINGNSSKKEEVFTIKNKENPLFYIDDRI